MKKIIIAIIIILIALGIIFGVSFFFSQKNLKLAEIDEHKFKLEIAISENEREKGLGGREELCQECGMLFIFPQKGVYSFWMKDMKFDLDIIWISDGKIVYLAKNVSHSDPATTNPQVSADKVLEINAGLSDKYSLKEGDRVNFSY